ncbi:MAG: 3-isopropylmalate dehydrogenase [Candidatus Schekmanbacteria bacterium]|nr:MAG: 3-isopropylmalate dehydrogenase [Candidatus Schekmanbacteria bacterium]
MRKEKIVVLPGDGVGPEVVEGAIEVLDAVGKRFQIKFDYEEKLIGGIAIDKRSTPLPDDTLKACKECGVILLGAVGGPKWDKLTGKMRPESGLLEIRKKLGLYANIRPAKIFRPLISSSTLKSSVLKNVDFVVVRELNSGIYYGKPRGIKKEKKGKKAFNTMVYDEATIRRIAETAFKIAERRKRKVVSVDKANVLECSRLWRDVVEDVHNNFSHIELSHMYVDNCAMQIIRDPAQFDVILTPNLFGDIISDEAAMITGSIGMLSSASIGEKAALYEPVHGSAPDIAGKDIANPLATILSAAMMLRYSLSYEEEASAIERAVEKVLKKGFRTKDIYNGRGKIVGTRKMSSLVAENL